MRTQFCANIVGSLTRSLPLRRWQAAHWLGKALVPRKPFLGRFCGGLIEVRPGEIASSAAFFTGFYEREVTIWALNQIRKVPPSLVVDVGANFGYYPLLFGLRTDGKTRSIAFEPDPENFAWLSRNLELNPSIHVTPVQAAVSDADGQTLEFLASRSGENLWARVADRGSDSSGSEKIEVPTITLDGYLDSQGVSSVPITLIDVEGYESQVLKGMIRGIAARRYEQVMVEFHPWAFPDPTAEAARIADLFLASGYRGYRFRHFSGQYCDKSGSYYRLDWSDSILGPLTFDEMGSWEHYLFVAAGQP